jgi:hypothetical protein
MKRSKASSGEAVASSLAPSHRALVPVGAQADATLDLEDGEEVALTVPGTSFYANATCLGTGTLYVTTT